MNTTTDHHTRREAALANVRRTEAAITGVFDARTELDAVLDAISSSATGNDPLRAALDVDELLPRLHAAVTGVRAAAVAACEFVTKSDVAGYLDTKPALLFPRAETRASNPDVGHTPAAVAHAEQPGM